MILSSRKRFVLATVAIAVAVAGTEAGAAYASGILTPAVTTIVPVKAYACEGAGHVAVTLLSTPSAKCPARTTSVVLGAQGPQGNPGIPGTPGSTGPSGVQALTTIPFSETDGITTGGSFLSKATLIGTSPMSAGTYQVCLNGKAEQPIAATGSVSAQLFLYDQASNANFTGDLLNASADTQGGTSHDAYLSGCTLVTEASDVTLHLYAFGYDSDQNSGSWNLMNARITAVKLTPAA
jgi:hypothetical protein